MILPVALNPPAAAQGALAIEIKQGRTDLETLARKINDRATFDNVLHERTTLKSYGGGCHQKIGVANIDKPFGRWHVLKGLTDQGKVLDVETLTTENQLPKAHSRENIFPQSTGDNNWFERKPIKAQIPANHALWVAKADAWPEGLKSEAIIWTSGMNSWRKLAEKGVWVNGCAENLGDESPQLEALVPEIKWVKLTHSQADGDGTVVTYALVPKSQDKSPCLKDKTHFYWMSGSSFKRAYELFPEELARGFHGCGPGLTFQQLSQEKRIRPPQIFLNLEAFLKAVLPP
jgi:hydroxymethylbilane synthase